MSDRVVEASGLRPLLEGRWLGHALHPLLTDAPLGFWMSGTALDLLGGDQHRPAARRLIGLGVLAAVPTALTGLAEWTRLSTRDRRTGNAHAMLNATGTLFYAASWLARVARRDGLGTTLALAAATSAAAGGYLGGHLTEVRNVSTHDPAFDHDS